MPEQQYGCSKFVAGGLKNKKVFDLNVSAVGLNDKFIVLSDGKRVSSET